MLFIPHTLKPPVISIIVSSETSFLSSFSCMCPRISCCVYTVTRLLLGEAEASVGPPGSMFGEILTISISYSP